MDGERWGSFVTPTYRLRKGGDVLHTIIRKWEIQSS